MPADPQDDPGYSAGLPDHHNPLRGAGGAPPAFSALTLRLALALFGFVLCAGGAVLLFVLGIIVLGIVFACAAAAALVDILVIARRKRRGEPG